MSDGATAETGTFNCLFGVATHDVFQAVKYPGYSSSVTISLISILDWVGMVFG